MQKITIHLFVVVVVAWIGLVSVSVSGRTTRPTRDGVCRYFACSCELRDGVPKCIGANGEEYCDISGKIKREELVCGSDGRTYPQPYIVALKSCKTNTLLTIKHWGECKTPTQVPKPTAELASDDYTDDERSCDD